MSSPVMIHLKSTLAVTAVMLAGLVAASPFPYPSQYEPRAPRKPVAELVTTAVEPGATMPVTTAAWTDPPAQPKLPVAQPAAETKPATEYVALPPAPDAAAPVVQQPAKAATRQVSAQARADQTRRRKMARAAARERQAALRQTAPAATATQETPAAEQRIDPIGDILRGLGIGKQG